MKELKTWANDNVTDKQLMKKTMQFASFVKKEVEEVGAVAMDTELSFDQEETIMGSFNYMKTQLNVEELSIIKLGTGSEEEGKIPPRVLDNANVTPGKPYLWFH